MPLSSVAACPVPLQPQTASLRRPRSPLFVTWSKAPARPGAGPFSLRGRRGAWRLRGCIGTLAARQLHAALPEYALTAALRDRRFSPVTPAEASPMLLACVIVGLFCSGARMGFGTPAAFAQAATACLFMLAPYSGSAAVCQWCGCLFHPGAAAALHRQPAARL